MICFKCGKIGHREDRCPTHEQDDSEGHQEDDHQLDPTIAIPANRPEYVEEFRSWMLVKKPQRKKQPRPIHTESTSKDGAGYIHPTTAHEAHDPNKETNLDPDLQQDSSIQPPNVRGSRFQILEDIPKEIPEINAERNIAIEL